MAELQINTAHRNAIAQASGDVFAGGTLQIRTGARPGANAAATGTLLVEIDLPATAFGVAATGVVNKLGTWSGTVLATGAPGHFRLISSDGLQIREGDAAETPGAGESMILSGLVSGDLVQDGTVEVSAYAITQPEGTADP